MDILNFSYFIVNFCLFFTQILVCTAIKTIKTKGSPGVVFIRADAKNYYGNDILLRDDYFASSGKNPWIDKSTTLPPGRMTRVFYYVHNVDGNSNTVNFKIQIWRPMSITNNVFQLVYEQDLNADLSSQTGYFYEVELQEAEFETWEGDRVGWISKDRVCPLSSTNNPNPPHTTIRSSSPDVPTLGNNRTFQENINTVLSIGVEVTPLPSTLAPSTTESRTTITPARNTPENLISEISSTSTVEPSGSQTVFQHITTQTIEGEKVVTPGGDESKGFAYLLRHYPAYVALVGMSIIVLLMFIVTIIIICTLTRKRHSKEVY